MDMREEKYFHVEGDLTSHPAVPTTGPKKVSVLSFATTSNLDPFNPGTTEKYCGHDIINLNMLRPYQKATPPTQLSSYAIEGKYVYPTASSVSWQIDRNWANVGPTEAAYGNTPTTAMTRLANQATVRCRMIRVTPKLAPGITTPIDPSTDLFLDQHGIEYSPVDSQFSYSDAEYAAVNRHKYTVLQDTKFNINAPFTQQWPMNPHGGNWNAVVTPNTRGQSSKKMVTRHQLSAKKGGAVHYKKPDDATTVNADFGQRREYVFLHFWYQSIDGGGAHGDLPDLGGSGIVPDANIVTTHFRTESRFKEA